MKVKEGKIALVTGGSRGIGKAISQRLAEDGATVIIADILYEAAVETCNELNALNLKTVPYQVDLSSSEDIANMFKYIKETYHTIDILVNNAAIQIRGASVNFLEENWDKVCDINLKSQWLTCQAAAKIMLKNGYGKIVSIASGTACRAQSQRAPYTITKSAVEGLARALGNEWARYGINVNCVSPGWTLTQMVQDGIDKGLVKPDEILPMVPLGRFMDPAEVANAVNFLASDEASGIVGQTLYCDGGGSIRCNNEPYFPLEIEE